CCGANFDTCWCAVGCINAACAALDIHGVSNTVSCCTLDCCGTASETCCGAAFDTCWCAVDCSDASCGALDIHGSSSNASCGALDCCGTASEACYANVYCSGAAFDTYWCA
ncbi:hypothetical protein NDU88_011211, partial [Pleurodeles waltl]